MAAVSETHSGAINTVTLSNCTDMAGKISWTLNVAFVAASITITFGSSFSTAPIVVITSGDVFQAQNFANVYITSTTTTFVINFNSSLSGTLYYHVFETQ